MVKWQNVCANVHHALRELIVSLSLGVIDKKMYEKACQTSCSKLCSLPVCIVSWMLNFKTSEASNMLSMDTVVTDFLAMCRQDVPFNVKVESGTPNSNNVMPFHEERRQLMIAIISRLEVSAGVRIPERKELICPPLGDRLAWPKNGRLREDFNETWQHVCKNGMIEVDSMA